MKKTLLLTLISVLWLVSFVSANTSIPNVGQSGVDNTYGSYEWVVCRADVNSAWVSSYHDTYPHLVVNQYGMYTAVYNKGGEYDPYAVCHSLGYETVDAYGETCGYVCGYCDQAIEYYNLGGVPTNHLTGRVHWRCSHFIGNQANQVPEFSLVAAGLALLGAGLFIFKKRN